MTHKTLMTQLSRTIYSCWANNSNRIDINWLFFPGFCKEFFHFELLEGEGGRGRG